MAVVIEADEAVSLRTFEEGWLLPLQGLVMLASREPTIQTELTLLLPDPLAESYHPAVTHGTPPGFWNTEEVEVLTATPGLAADPSSGYEHLLVPFGALGDEMAGFVRAWFRLYAELGDAAIMLMSAFGSRLFLENKLLNEMSFAESYHRTKHNEPAVPADEHLRLVEKMLAAIQHGPYREHYEQKLRYAAEQTARRRLKWLVLRAAEVLPEVPWLKRKLADDLIDTRNALTHPDPSVPTPLIGRDLLYGVLRLELVLQVNLLLDLELAPEFVAGLIRHSYDRQAPLSTLD